MPRTGPPAAAKRAHGVHDRRNARDRPGAEVVAVGEAAGKHDGAGPGRKLRLLRAIRARARLPSRRAPRRRRGRRSSPGRRRRRRGASRSRRLPLEPDLEALDERIREELCAHPLRSALVPPRLRPPRPRGRPHAPRARAWTSKPSFRRECLTASPCGSRMPSFGRTRTVAFTGPTSGRATYSSNGISVRRSNAST